MIRREKEGIIWLEFALLADLSWLKHGVFLRHGGVSSGSYESLNAGGGNDDPLAVKENRARMQKIMGGSLVSAYQVHGADIAYVDRPVEEVAHCDALLTDKADLGLMIRHADCQAAIFVDPARRVIANVHCGWRGNVKNIYAVTITEMHKRFGTRPEHILVGVSPSLGPEHSEFLHYRKELPEAFWSYQIRPTYFDLWAIARMQLEAAGILPHHMEIASMCTYAHAEDFFSYRRDRKMGHGNHATIVAIHR